MKFISMMMIMLRELLSKKTVTHLILSTNMRATKIFKANHEST